MALSNVMNQSGQNGEETENPHQRLHKIVYFFTVTCLVAQVIEGTLIVPLVLLYFGFPQLGLTDICDEMYKIIYRDEQRVCEFPYPIQYEPEPWKQKNQEHIFGHVTPPAPAYNLPGYREIITIRAQRLNNKNESSVNKEVAHDE